MFPDNQELELGQFCELIINRINVEAAIGNFGPELGSYIRLSYGIYNTQDDIEMLKDAVLDILKRQQNQP